MIQFECVCVRACVCFLLHWSSNVYVCNYICNYISSCFFFCVCVCVMNRKSLDNNKNQTKKVQQQSPSSNRYLWIRHAIFEKQLAKILDYLVQNSRWVGWPVQVIIWRRTMGINESVVFLYTSCNLSCPSALFSLSLSYDHSLCPPSPPPPHYVSPADCFSLCVCVCVGACFIVQTIWWWYVDRIRLVCTGLFWIVAASTLNQRRW